MTDPRHADRASIVAAMGQVGKAMTRSRSGTVDETLQRITAAARVNLPGADHVSVTVRHADGQLETFGPTSELAKRIDLLQYELHEGACYESMTDDRRIVSVDLRHDGRWPNLGAAAAEMGLLAQASYVIESDGDRVVLNVYSEQPNEFHDRDGLAELFAGHAAAALGHAREVEPLGRAIGSRTVIGQATGIVMERYGLGPVRAFEFLVRLSQDSNRKLVDIAVGIVETSANGSE